MKIRRRTTDIPDAVEREAEEAVRRLAGEQAAREVGMPSETYFANLLVRTNERIDRATSGKAISLSWLARVAVPGVVAIVFFFIALHYYAPEKATQSSVVDAVKALPPSALDSLLLGSAPDTESAALLQPSLFDVSPDQLAEFYMETENPFAVLGALAEQQVREVAAILEARSANL